MHWHRRIPLALTAAGALGAGVIASASTTADPGWWQSCFSRLGAMGDASSLVFNGGVIVAGAVIIASAIPTAVRLHAASPAGSWARSALPTLLPLLIAALGLSLVLIGLLPLSVDLAGHETAANGAIASSAAMLILHRVFLRGLSRALDGIATGAAVVLTVGFIGMTAGLVSLTVFEGLAFGVILSWLHTLERRLKGSDEGVRKQLSANSQQRVLSPIWGTSTLGVTLKSAPGEAGQVLGTLSG
ncbi:hypothetical protein [Microbacterium sp. 22242]|uniref:hypothetical protein n=1 Tax=Microbacterium sp. 22242 TaxID=3453896 RepID=UPI003F844F9E